MDGFTEELISEIGHFCPRQLRVIAPTSVMQYKQSSKTIEQIGKELHADFLLEGSIGGQRGGKASRGPRIQKGQESTIALCISVSGSDANEERLNG